MTRHQTTGATGTPANAGVFPFGDTTRDDRTRQDTTAVDGGSVDQKWIRPATIVDGYALFRGGHVRKLTKRERRLHELGLLDRVRR